MGTHDNVNDAAPTEGGTAARTHPAALAAIATLEQCERFLTDLDDEVYCRTCDAVQGSTIGQHLRHSLDHVHASLSALDGVEIDYDHRERETRIERDRHAALTSIRETCARLACVDEKAASRTACVRVMLDDSGAESTLGSTLGREIAFASHHALHHQAMIGAIAHRLGVAPPEGFGRAPSTVRHDRRVGRG
ncbi:MAG: hypothetical protein EA379_10245 [Phycisphaerales bacterium]|nr:MAG: hypothetical protein EA379_10245 [Phycisphaerales bacterium]